MTGKWPRFGGPRPSWQLGWAVNWMDLLHTSADKKMWSGRCAVVMVWWAAVGCGCSALICCSSWTGNWAAATKGSPSGLQRTGRRAELLRILRNRCRAVVSDVLCVRSYVQFVCTCVYMCMCVYICICAFVYVYVYVCVYAHVYVFVYAYLCIDCESQYQCFSVWMV